MKTPMHHYILGGLVSAAMLAGPTAAIAAEGDIVLIQGVMADEESAIFENGLFGDGNTKTFGPDDKDMLIAAACESPAVNDAFALMHADLTRRVAEHTKNRGKLPADGLSVMFWRERKEALEKETEAYSDLVDKAEKTCETKARNPLQAFNIIFTSCSMYMQQGQQEMMIVLPPSVRGAHMALRSPGEKPVTADLNVMAAATDGMMPISATMDEARVSLAAGENRGNHLGAATRKYDISFRGSGAEFIPGLPGAIVTSKGTAWLAPDAPGIDVVRSFYRNFAQEVKTPGVVNGFMSGLIEQMSAMTAKGMPMYLEQTVSSKNSGPFRFGHSGTSAQAITGIGVLPRAALTEELANFCNASIVSPGEKTQDLNQMIAGGDTPEEQAEMQQAMSEAQKAMEALDPETRALMKSLGVSLPGMD